jgi:hypothetical protein
MTYAEAMAVMRVLGRDNTEKELDTVYTVLATAMETDGSVTIDNKDL